MKFSYFVSPLRSSAHSQSIMPSMPEMPWPKPSTDRPSPGWSTRSTSPWRTRWGEECVTNPRQWGRAFTDFILSPLFFWPGTFKEERNRAFGHIWIWGFLCKQVIRNPSRSYIVAWFFWAWAVCHDPFPQFWAVLYKLLQWEAAAAFHPVDAQGWAGRIRSRRYWGNLGNLKQKHGRVNEWMNDHDWACLHWLVLNTICLVIFPPVGAGSVLQQQDHLWPGWGETQRNHINTGVCFLLE